MLFWWADDVVKNLYEKENGPDDNAGLALIWEPVEEEALVLGADWVMKFLACSVQYFNKVEDFPGAGFVLESEPVVEPVL